MTKYNISAEEVTTLINLYSKITDTETRRFAQGYLKGLSENFTNEQIQPKVQNNHPA